MKKKTVQRKGTNLSVCSLRRGAKDFDAEEFQNGFEEIFRAGRGGTVGPGKQGGENQEHQHAGNEGHEALIGEPLQMFAEHRMGQDVLHRIDGKERLSCDGPIPANFGRYQEQSPQLPDQGDQGNPVCRPEART